MQNAFTVIIDHNLPVKVDSIIFPCDISEITYFYIEHANEIMKLL